MTEEEILSLPENEQYQLVWSRNPKILEALSHSLYKKVRREVSMNPFTEPNTLRKLYFDDDLAYKYMTLKNVNAPEDIHINHNAERFFLRRQNIKFVGQISSECLF